MLSLVLSFTSSLSTFLTSEFCPSSHHQFFFLCVKLLFLYILPYFLPCLSFYVPYLQFLLIITILLPCILFHVPQVTVLLMMLFCTYHSNNIPNHQSTQFPPPIPSNTFFPHLSSDKLSSAVPTLSPHNNFSRREN